MATLTSRYTVHLRQPHAKQELFIGSTAKRKVVRAGRRGGKTVGIAVLAVKRFLAGDRVLYTAPTTEQIETFWREIKLALVELIDAGIYKKNETEHTIERPGTQARIKAKTVWNADTLRGDFADLLIFDEFQLCNEDAWSVVGAPMLLDNDGDAVFIYTPPSLRSSGVSKAHDPFHAAKLYKMADADTTGRWETFHFSSRDNPHISTVALNELISDMSKASYRQEIEAEDEDENPELLIYRAFDDRVCKIPPFPLDDDSHRHWPRYVGHDFGGSNPAAIFIAQDPATGIMFAYHEYLPGGGLSTSQHVEAFKHITNNTDVLVRMGGSHQEDEIRQGYSAHGWPITEPTVHAVRAGIDRVRSLMEQNKLFIFDTLPLLLTEISTYAWLTDPEGLVTGDIRQKSRYHLLDSVRYILSRFRPDTVPLPANRVASGMAYKV